MRNFIFEEFADNNGIFYFKSSNKVAVWENGRIYSSDFTSNYDVKLLGEVYRRYGIDVPTAWDVRCCGLPEFDHFKVVRARKARTAKKWARRFFEACVSGDGISPTRSGRPRPLKGKHAEYLYKHIQVSEVFADRARFNHARKYTFDSIDGDASVCRFRG